jgi:hypothetical protein
MKDRVLKIAFIVIIVVAIFEGLVLLMVICNPFPPEHVYYQIPSQDGKLIALFSVKYQGVISWIPNDIEPYYYLTLVDTAHRRVGIRTTEFRGTMEASFAELARQHAPWAVQEFGVANGAGSN